MTARLRNKTDEAIEAIQAVHSDTSGPVADNIEAIEELLDAINNIRACLEQDLKNA